ncbi:MAG: hypothetical protein AAF682_27670 [Planctomycetota bacterium]
MHPPPSTSPTRLAVYLSLRSSSGSVRVDLDLWLGILDLAATHGWRPRMTSDPDPSLQLKFQQGGTTLWTPSAYFLPCGQRIGPTDARALAEGAKTGLARASAQELPLTGERFGEEHTQSLIERAAKERPMLPEDARAAFEVLSGEPAREASGLLKFLRGGEVRVCPDARREG